MGCRKQLFGEKSNCKGVVTESSASQTMHTTNVAVADGRSEQDHDGLPACISEGGTSSCTPGRNEDVVAGISEAGTSSSRGMFSPMAIVTESENATPDAEKKYTHKEDIDPALIPRPGMSFRNRKEARAFYEAYAEEELRVRNNTTKKTHCMSKMKLKRIYDENKNEISVVIEQVDLMHNHPCLKKKEEIINMRSHKEKDPVLLEFVDDLQAADVPHHSIQNIVRDMHGGGENVPMTRRDLENRKAANVRAEHANDIAKLLEFFEDCKAQNPQFCCHL
ncbi:unnamed protein product [Miscanthus lutarioriparius]|uniref:FAR1 domain-containing protein n=1 Tax=Miscanthus lutarioriparius TaxID=422564 RepID=A0A811NG33_9POAL|nr:unnamed protein product [Miscanthus lutarioriparius]